MIFVTQHAAERWVERVAPHFTIDQAKAEIRTHTAMIIVAANFGATTIKLGCGARLILEERNVVTVIGRDQRRKHPRA